MRPSLDALLAAAGFTAIDGRTWTMDVGDGSVLGVRSECGSRDPSAPIWLASRMRADDTSTMRETIGGRDLPTALFVANGFTV